AAPRLKFSFAFTVSEVLPNEQDTAWNGMNAASTTREKWRRARVPGTWHTLSRRVAVDVQSLKFTLGAETRGFEMTTPWPAEAFRFQSVRKLEKRAFPTKLHRSHR